MTTTKVQKGDRTHYTVDAAGQSLGRVASEAASILLGKKSATYMQNEVVAAEVEIVNASKLVMSEKRIAGKDYTHYTGYPGGLRITPLARLLERKGVGEALRKAVDGMIPRNKLRKERMKRLTITD
ncbi:50S ribosomal protein L13 [Patescibacteria group bacterium]|nr:50S ribosomal protein L13 [Patescibacteria group bacterium]MBU1500922.1 50S ribosomal protein L13 [Patescibacteria group bacterium]MBU2080553.1 50S ribosomal protein L13 [Patescibacteria group bacterium]MBU2124371.1 50S ribosomal protein L13 [Patescibacteria group bacterium]MBU2194498.1 50S ribosomal protein L13 [Patescibacteria group bacterium]